MLYSNYNGRRVSDKKEDKSFKLFRQKGGKRLAEKPKENNIFQQAIQFFAGKIKNISDRFQELNVYLDYDEEDESFFESEETSISPEELMNRFYTTSQEPTKILPIHAYTLSDIDDVLYYLEEGYIVIVEYKTLNAAARKEFDRRLSMELMSLGTHLTHISSTEIICAGRNVSIVDNISKKREGKVYDLQTVMKR